MQNGNDKFRQVCFAALWPLKAGELEASLERSDYYEETLALLQRLALIAIVHGYVSETQRVVAHGRKQLRVLCLHTLETDRCTAPKFAKRSAIKWRHATADAREALISENYL